MESSLGQIAAVTLVVAGLVTSGPELAGITGASSGPLHLVSTLVLAAAAALMCGSQRLMRAFAALGMWLAALAFVDAAYLAWAYAMSAAFVLGSSGTACRAVVAVASIEALLVASGVDRLLLDGHAQLWRVVVQPDVCCGASYMWGRTIALLSGLGACGCVFAKRWRALPWISFGYCAVSVAACGLAAATVEAGTAQRSAWTLVVALPLMATSVYALLLPAASWRCFARMHTMPLVYAGVGITVALSGVAMASGFEGRRIVFVNEGGFDWNIPEIGKYGGFSSGMFGMLPHYLTRAGHSVKVEDWGAQATRDADVLVTINNPRVWDAANRRLIEDYLQGGGALLVLGDHTNVFGLQEGLNSLLEPMGCRLEFDSAYPIDGKWRGCIDVRFPLTMSRSAGGRRIGHAIGASLTVDQSWHAMLSGTLAFSDIGIATNEQGSFLGNYFWDDGERVGDICLAAWRDYGAGRIVVYGDTSAFQNTSLSECFLSHVGPVFEWMARPRWLECVVRWLIMAAAVVLLCSGWTGSRVMSCCGVVGLGIVAYCFATTMSDCDRIENMDQDGLVISDAYALPNTGHYDAGWNSPGPLMTNLYRRGYWTLTPTDRVDYGNLRASGVILIAPHRSLASDAGLIATFMRRGGVVICASGYLDRRGVEPVLSDAGVSILPRPLGRLQSRELSGRLEPRFVDCYPIAVDGQHEKLATAGDQTLAAFVNVGSGGMIVVGDTRYFASHNVESMSGPHPGNTAFVLSAIERFLVPPCSPLATFAPNPPAL